MGQRQSTVRSQFANLRWKLLLAFLGVFSLGLGAEALSFYRSITHSLYEQLEAELLALAEAAAYAFEDGKIDPSEADILVGGNTRSLDLPWDYSRSQRLGVEWFDPAGQMLYQVGHIIGEPWSYEEHLDRDWVDGNWVLSLKVEGATPDTPKGYVRVTIDGNPTIQELQRLKRGLIEGGAVALVICGIGSWWLMRLVMIPIEQSFERLRQFTADASHELRSPLTAIQASMDVMQSHPERFQPTDLAKLKLTASATQQMSQLVEDLLLLSRFDSSTSRSDTALLLLDELLEDLADLYSLRLGNQPITMETRLKAGAHIYGDIGQLKRVFTNLLDNAVKYTPPPGTITLSSHQHDNAVIVTISDTGIGIAPENLGRVFDRFWRADEARSYQNGSGLGLSIVRSIVQAHQGSISLTSQLHHGTQVRVSLPIAKMA